ncbi:hypothetical protein [Pandoraea terrae]|uniref:hypothetical protein n=1 Tax=Pandoraea terrae TaxID=1537710 RepID=UPI00123EE554|nr:hypothetical protein [Pandoraea terrae]
MKQRGTSAGEVAPMSRADVISVTNAVLTLLRDLSTFGEDKSARLAMCEKYASRIARPGQGAALDAKAINDCYLFFKAAQQAGGERVVKGGHDDWAVRDAYLTCRTLKWRFRAAVSELIKHRLDRVMEKNVSAMRGGSSESVTIGAAGKIGPVGLQVSAAHGMSVSQAGYALQQKSGSARVFVGAKVTDGVSADGGVKLIHTRRAVYDKLSDYVAARGHKLITWLTHAKLDLLFNLRDVVKLTTSYERDIRRANISHPFLVDQLQRLRCNVACRPLPGAAPRELERHAVTEISADAGVAAGLPPIVTGSGKLACAHEHAVKRGRLDIMSLLDRRPDDARESLRDTCHEYTDLGLQFAMEQHAQFGSEAVVEALTNMSGGKQAMAVLDEVAKTSHGLLKQFARLKLDGYLSEDVERDIRALIARHPEILRPASLEIYRMSCVAKQRVVRAGVEVTVPQLGVQLGVNIAFKHVTEDEDPYYCGKFVDVSFDGLLDGTAILTGALEASVSPDGVVNPVAFSDALAMVPSVTKGYSTRALYKVKGGRLKLMVAQALKTSGIPLDSSGIVVPGWRGNGDAPENSGGTPSDFLPVSVSLVSAQRLVEKETLGTECLDLLLPIARSRLGGAAGRPWWDNYVEAHRDDFDQLLFNIAQRSTGSTLDLDLAEIARNAPRTAPLITRLTDCARRMAEAPTPSHRATAHDALAQVLLAYLDDHYRDAAAQNWSLSTRP